MTHNPSKRLPAPPPTRTVRFLAHNLGTWAWTTLAWYVHHVEASTSSLDHTDVGLEDNHSITSIQSHGSPNSQCTGSRVSKTPSRAPSPPPQNPISLKPVPRPLLATCAPQRRRRDIRFVCHIKIPLLWPHTTPRCIRCRYYIGHRYHFFRRQ